MDKSKGRILLVDDDAHTIEILTRMLAREGYACLSASSGAGGLALLATEPVDVILLDVMMPDMDGLQVCERLRQDDRLRPIPVILLTARDDMETRAQGMALGVSEYLTKPINKRELFMRIDAQLKLVAAQQKLGAIDRQLSETLAAVADTDKLR